MSQQIAKQYSAQLLSRWPTPTQIHSLDRARCYIEPGDDLLEGEEIGGVVGLVRDQFAVLANATAGVVVVVTTARRTFRGRFVAYWHTTLALTRW